MKRLILNHHFWLLGILSMIFNSCSTKYKVVSENSGARKIYNLKYGEDKRNTMDVFLPEKYSSETPIVMLIHGGAWVFGNKGHVRSIQNFLMENNIPTVNINYRLVDKNTTYKTLLDDISKAFETFHSKQKEWNLNREKLILLGESAGGHLALLYGYQNPNKVEKIISLSGPTDFYSEKYLNSKYYKNSYKTFQKVVGEKYDGSDLEAFKKSSPIYVAANVPTLHFQGTNDFLVNKEQGLALDSVLTEKKIPHQFVYMQNTGHAPRFFKKKRENLVYPNILKFIKE